MNKNNNQQETREPENGSVGDTKLSRRKFLSGTGAVALGTTAVLIGGGLFPTDSLAAARLGDSANATLLRLARDIYPHDSLEDKYYSQVMMPMAKEAAKNDELLELLFGGVKTLNNLAQSFYGTPYLEVKKEQDRVVILKQIESTPFFQKVKGALLMGIYNNPELWPRFGYGGSAWQKGGYINRGYDEIDWV